MKYSLPNLTCGLLWLSLCQLAAQYDVSRAAEISGQQLVAEAASRLALQPAVAAKIRQRGLLMGQELVGSGAYQQVLSEGRTRIRLELRLQVDERQTTLLQISDGVVLWIRRDDDAQRAVGYVNLRLVREAASRAGVDQVGTLSPESLAIGGLSQLLQGLERNFDFSPPVEESLVNVPVWTVRGRWKKERLAELVPDRKEQILSGAIVPTDRLPAHVPECVTVMLGRDDFVPLFPYCIEYGRRDAVTHPRAAEQGRGGGAAGPMRTILKMELFEVRREWDIDPQAFEYRPGTQQIKNETDLYLRRLGLTGQ